MSKTFDYSGGLGIESLIEKFEHFHDWTIIEVRIFPDVDELSDGDFMNICYDAEVVFKDPYNRFETNVVSMVFKNFDSVSAKDWSRVCSQTQEVSVTRTPTSVRLVSDGEHFSIEARSVQIRLSKD